MAFLIIPSFIPSVNVHFFVFPWESRRVSFFYQFSHVFYTIFSVFLHYSIGFHSHLQIINIFLQKFWKFPGFSCTNKTRRRKSAISYGVQSHSLKSSAAEEASGAAEKIAQITHTQIRAGIGAHGKAPEVPRLLAIGRTAVFDLVQCPEIFLVVRLHAHSLAYMLQCRDLIAQAVIGQRTEIVPPGIALLGIL